MPENTLASLAARIEALEKQVAEHTAAAVRRRSAGIYDTVPVESVPGVDPIIVWEAAAQAEAGRLTPHAEVFGLLRLAARIEAVEKQFAERNAAETEKYEYIRACLAEHEAVREARRERARAGLEEE